MRKDRLSRTWSFPPYQCHEEGGAPDRCSPGTTAAIYRKRKKFRGGNIFAIILIYSRAPLHRENIVREMSPCFSRVTLLLAVDSLCTFAVTSSQSYLHSPLPRSHVFTRYCRAVVSSLALPRSRVFTRHCRAVVSSLATANGPLRHSSVCVTV